MELAQGGSATHSVIRERLEIQTNIPTTRFRYLLVTEEEKNTIKVYLTQNGSKVLLEFIV